MPATFVQKEPEGRFKRQSLKCDSQTKTRTHAHPHTRACTHTHAHTHTYTYTRAEAHTHTHTQHHFRFEWCPCTIEYPGRFICIQFMICMSPLYVMHINNCGKTTASFHLHLCLHIAVTTIQCNINWSNRMSRSRNCEGRNLRRRCVGSARLRAPNERMEHH